MQYEEDQVESLKEEIIEIAQLKEDLGEGVQSLVGGVDNLTIVLTYLSTRNLVRYSRDLVKYSADLVKESRDLSRLTIALYIMTVAMVVLGIEQVILLFR